MNINGDTDIRSYPGTGVSIVSKFKDYYDSSFQVNLTDIGVKFAFGVVDFDTGKSLEDPNFV